MTVLTKRQWPRLLGGARDGDPAPEVPPDERHLLTFPPLDESALYSATAERPDVLPQHAAHYVREKFAFGGSSLVLEALVAVGEVEKVGPRLWESLVDAGIRVAAHSDRELRAMAEDLYDQLIAPQMARIQQEVVQHVESASAAAGSANPFPATRHEHDFDQLREIIVQGLVTMARGVQP